MLGGETPGRPGVPPLVRIGLAYVRFAREFPEDFLLLFARLPSRRRSTTEAPGTRSPFALVLAAAREHRAQRGFRTKGGDEELAYAVWAQVHGMAMLQLTHLKGFGADFETADEQALRSLLAGWTR